MILLSTLSPFQILLSLRKFEKWMKGNPVKA